MGRRAPAGYQQHHLLPRAILRQPDVRHLLDQITGIGGDRRAASCNCLWLPCDESIALTTGRALHRGPHPRYNDVVAARVDRVLARYGRSRDRTMLLIASVHLARLQACLTRILAGRGPRLIQLNRRDPLRAFADYSYLDAAISRLATASQPVAASTAIGSAEVGIGGTVFAFEPVDEVGDAAHAGDAADPLT